DEYLARRAAAVAVASAEAAPVAAAVPAEGLSAKEERELRKELSRLERRLDRLGEREAGLHAAMAEAADDYERLGRLDAELKEIASEKDTVEADWLALADRLE
ncbi:glycerophosphodiester phosphodiesterase, partial [Spongiactinospora gelatinilytica]